jgi:hypothetical protein
MAGERRYHRKGIPIGLIVIEVLVTYGDDRESRLITGKRKFHAEVHQLKIVYRAAPRRSKETGETHNEVPIECELLEHQPLIPAFKMQNGLRALVENRVLLYIREKWRLLDVGDHPRYRAEGCIATENEPIDTISLARHE